MANSGFENWTAGIDARVRDTSQEKQPWTKNSIYKVPAYLRQSNPKAFTPQVVSFGPYHHGDKKLKLMEVHKERAVVGFIKRAGQPLKKLVQKIRRSVETLREAYSCLDEKWMTDDDAFVKMMILDGCFMYELLLSGKQTIGCLDMDPFFAEISLQRSIIMNNDMLLIENQLSVTLLKILALFQRPQYQEADLTSLINQWAISLGFNKKQLNRGDIEGRHLLDICLKSNSLPKSSSSTTIVPGKTNTNSSSAITIVRYSALELHEAGVRFIKSKTSCFDDVGFNPQDGTFHLPQLIVGDRTERIFRNMIAFEQLHPTKDGKFVPYIWLMGEIIYTADDVSLLRQSGIIENILGSDEEVGLLFNRVTENMILYNCREVTQFRKDISIFCGKRRNKWRASLNHTYFQSPWSVISLVGVALVILLAIIQTICAIIQV